MPSQSSAESRDADVVTLDEHFFADRGAFYRGLRANRPVTKALAPNGLNMRIITRYADARAALTDPRLVKGPARIASVFERHSGRAPLLGD